MNWKTILAFYPLAGICGFLLAKQRSGQLHDIDAPPAPAKAVRREAAGAFPHRSGNKEWERLVMEGGMNKSGDEPSPTYTLLGNHGEIREEKLRLAGLEPEQERQVLDVLREAREAMLKMFAERVQRDRRQPTGTEGEIWYFIPHDLDRGSAVFDRMEGELTSACGKEKARELIRAISPMQHYANFGRQDTSLRWRRQEVNGQVQWVGHFHCYDGPTGQEAVGGLIMSPADLEARFGEVFEWPDDDH